MKPVSEGAVAKEPSMHAGQIRVLVVDDDPDDFYLVNEMLKQSQRKAFVVTHCESLECAGQVLQHSPVDIVLLDLGLGPLQGIQTLESFLSLGFCTPVIVLTGVHDEVLGEQSIKLGAEDYLPKNEASSALLIRAITYAIERYALVEQLEKRANEDALTGLANRHALMGQTTTLINNLERSGSTLAVALLDLDDFKGVNDRWGHNAGDQVIVALAHRLQSHLRSSDLVARIGGDEFVWVLTNYSSADNLVDVIEKKLSYLMQPLVLEEYPDAPKQLIKVSLGVAEWKPGLGLKELLSRADKAMYQSKKSRNQGVVIY